MDNWNWPKSFFYCFVALCITVSLVFFMHYGTKESEMNMQLMEEGIYGLSPEEASKIMREKKND